MGLKILELNIFLQPIKYVTGYACKGNQPTGALPDMFEEDLVNTADEATGAKTKSLCTKMGAIKRDIRGPFQK